MKFVTLTNHRSGSSLFQRFLHSHPNIIARQEDLRNVDRVGYGVSLRKLDQIYATVNEQRKAVGFKLMYTHIFPGLIEWLKVNDVKFIHLIRRDILETALWYRKHFNGEASGGLGPRLVVEGKVEAIIPEVIKQMKDIYENINKYRSLADFTVYYEDFTNNEDVQVFYNKEVQKELLDFLGVEHNNLSVYEQDNKKNIRPPSNEVVSNWNELMDAVEKSGIPPVLKKV